jgi:pilus assembly protein CpaB
MKRRRLITAAIISLAAIMVWLMYERRYEMEVSGGEKIKVLIALQPIERGRTIQEEQLGVKEVPQAYVEDRAIKDVERQKVLGLRVSAGLSAQQTLMWTDVIAATEDKHALGTMVPPGSRAVSIRTSQEDASSSMIRPGDYVDLIGLFGQQTTNADSRTSVVLLQKILVLATGLQTAPGADDNAGKPNLAADYDTLLTLSLTLPQAQVLSLTAEKGRIMVALRNPEDPRTFEQPPDLSAGVLTDSNQRENLRGVRHGGIATRLDERPR